jgi:hypothetical protein
MNLDLAISYAPVPGFPAGSAVAGIQVTVTGTAPGNTTPIVQTVAPFTLNVAFPLTVADTYTYSVQAIDAATPPDTFGDAVTGSFTITAPVTVTLTLPSSVVASQS